MTAARAGVWRDGDGDGKKRGQEGVSGHDALLLRHGPSAESFPIGGAARPDATDDPQAYPAHRGKSRIQLIEESRGEKLFELKDKKYYLTEAGRVALGGAEAIVAKGLAWLRGQYDLHDGLQNIRIRDEHGLPIFFSSQHRLTRIWDDGTDLLQQALHCWGNEWLCAEIGEKSALALWHGWEWAKSSVGRHVEEIPASTVYGEYIIDAYDDVRRSGRPRLDHQFRSIARHTGGELEPMSYQRLLLACRFPDGDMALASVVDMTSKVEIGGLEQEALEGGNGNG